MFLLSSVDVVSILTNICSLSCLSRKEQKTAGKSRNDIVEPPKSDDIKDALNYKLVGKRVTAFIQKSKFQLVETLAEKISKIMDLSPYGIKEKLSLNRPIYSKTAAYGHFGRKSNSNGEFPWEELDLVKSLKSIFE